MSDLDQRDLSTVPEEEMTPEERDEVRRRLDDFLDRMRDSALKPKKAVQKPKRITAWSPPVLERKP